MKKYAKLVARLLADCNIALLRKKLRVEDIEPEKKMKFWALKLILIYCQPVRVIGEVAEI